MTLSEYLNVLLDPTASQSTEVRALAQDLKMLATTPEQIVHLVRVQGRSKDKARVSEVAYELLQYLTSAPEWVAA